MGKNWNSYLILNKWLNKKSHHFSRTLVQQEELPLSLYLLFIQSMSSRPDSRSLVRPEDKPSNTMVFQALSRLSWLMKELALSIRVLVPHGWEKHLTPPLDLVSMSHAKVLLVPISQELVSWVNFWQVPLLEVLDLLQETHSMSSRLEWWLTREPNPKVLLTSPMKYILIKVWEVFTRVFKQMLWELWFWTPPRWHAMILANKLWREWVSKMVSNFNSCQPSLPVSSWLVPFLHSILSELDLWTSHLTLRSTTVSSTAPQRSSRTRDQWASTKVSSQFGEDSLQPPASSSSSSSNSEKFWEWAQCEQKKIERSSKSSILYVRSINI